MKFQNDFKFWNNKTDQGIYYHLKQISVRIIFNMDENEFEKRKKSRGYKSLLSYDGYAFKLKSRGNFSSFF